MILTIIINVRVYVHLALEIILKWHEEKNTKETYELKLQPQLINILILCLFYRTVPSRQKPSLLHYNWRVYVGAYLLLQASSLVLPLLLLKPQGVKSVSQQAAAASDAHRENIPYSVYSPCLPLVEMWHFDF